MRRLRMAVTGRIVSSSKLLIRAMVALYPNEYLTPRPPHPHTHYITPGLDPRLFLKSKLICKWKYKLNYANRYENKTVRNNSPSTLYRGVAWAEFFDSYQTPNKNLIFRSFLLSSLPCPPSRGRAMRECLASISWGVGALTFCQILF